MYYIFLAKCFFVETYVNSWIPKITFCLLYPSSLDFGKKPTNENDIPLYWRRKLS